MNNKTRRKRSIEGNIRNSLLWHSFFIVALLWIFQVMFLGTYYQTMQKASILRAGEQILSSVSGGNFEGSFEDICYAHRMCGMVVDSSAKSVYSVDMMGRGCLIHSPARFSLMRTIAPVLRGEQEELVLTIQDDHFHTRALIYARAYLTGNGERQVVVLNATLDPVKSTAGILKSQLGIITIVLALISIVISKILAHNISKPLLRITEKAQGLASGTYDADFNGGGILEMDELAETLNFAAQGLSKVEELRRELLANVSHDLKTPLTMIKAYAEMIRDLTGDNAIKRGEQLEVIVSETDRLSALVNQLIRTSQDERAGRQYRAEVFDLAGMLREVALRFEQTNPEYTVELLIDAPPMALADPESIGQVIYNLVSNAINYTGEDRRVSVEMKRAGNMTRVEIRDTGRGIAPEQLSLIWERYYRSQNTHQRPVAGSGLGLSIVRANLTAQNLAFGVESVVGEGSCFWFEMPCEEQTGIPPKIEPSR